MQIKKIAFFSVWLAGLGLAMQAPSADKAQKIVDKAMKVHGSARLKRAEVVFDFRGRHYKALRRDGIFAYERQFQDSLGRQVRDVLANEGLYREIDGQRTELSERERNAYAESVNSVVYFALLPYALNDPAVVKTYLGEETIQGQPYHKIRVTFRQDGGGQDFEDVYTYWVHRKRYTMDYLAYSFHVNGGGMRFRQAVNPQVVSGIRFQDYINFQPQDWKSVRVEDLGQLFDQGKLKELSRIENEQLRVTLL